MNYKTCPHYTEIATLVSEGRDLEDISFEINEVGNCKECSENEAGSVCTLWVMLAFIGDIKPQINFADEKVTIENLDDEIAKVALRLANAVKLND